MAAAQKKQNATLLDAFIEGTIEPQNFQHRDHVEVAFELLKRESFDNAIDIYVAGLKRLVAAAGVPEKFNMTITLAYLALIAEHMGEENTLTWQKFIDRNPELLDTKMLHRWYAPEKLHSERARHAFLMPSAGH